MTTADWNIKRPLQHEVSIKQMAFAWVGGWVFMVHPKMIEDANKNNLDFFRPATVDDYLKQYSRLVK